MLDPARPFLISPPFGSYLRSSRAYSVLGSFTRLPRSGWLGRVLRTVRPLGRDPDGTPRGWLNDVGLRNPGWDNVETVRYRTSGGVRSPKNWFIYSLAPLETTDWSHLERWLDDRFNIPLVEINVSCSNIAEYPTLPPDGYIKRLHAATIIWKLPPLPSSVDTALRLADLGARYVHMSNTLPSPAGGISGAALREANLPLVERVASVMLRSGHRAGFDRVSTRPGENLAPNDTIRLAMNGYVEIIAGGGIYAPEHLRQYRDAGATRFSLATTFMLPWRGYGIIGSLGR